MDHILKGLNEAQRAAVTSDASVLQILAPPGSGKTKTLTTRVAHLIAHHGYNPRHIVVCTFTVKAAREMKERIRSFLGDDLAGQLILGTFHSIARRFIAKYGTHIGIHGSFGICDASDTLSILTRIIKRFKFNIQPAQARSRISRLKSQCVSPQEVQGIKKVEQQEFAQIYAEYEEALKLANLLDYDDLLLRCADLLRSYPQCVRNIEALLIDEFQDTNNVQFDLMALFAQEKKRITIVGDPDQSIYGFRSAEIKNLIKMREMYPETHVINLEENYRSAGAILLVASEVIEQDESRPAKRLKPTHSIGMQPVLRRLPSAGAEASWIVAEIKRTLALTGTLLNWSDFAILLRSASLSRLIESALGKAGIPYRMVGGHRFFDRVEVKLVLDYLRVIDHPDHNDALSRVVNVPSRKVGDITIQRLLQEADKKKVTVWNLILSICRGTSKTSYGISTQAQRGLEQFTNLILNAQRKLGEMVTAESSLADFVKYVIQKVGVQDHLKKTKAEDFEARWANVEELVAQASDPIIEVSMEEDSVTNIMPELELNSATPSLTLHRTLSKFLANVALSTEVQKEDDNGGQRVEQVTLSTIHAAKGLEWPVVFVPATYEGSIPHSRAEDNDEERRLLYVAMTRAQSILYLSCPKRDSKFEQTTLSGFLSQNPIPCYLAEHGPSVSYDDVLELAIILRRECPTSSQIDACRSELEREHDDLWPANGDENEHESRRREYGMATDTVEEEMPAYKKPRIGGSLNDVKCWPVKHVAKSTIMKQSSSYAVTTTIQKTAFMTATTALHNLVQEENRLKEVSRSAAVEKPVALQRHAKDHGVSGQSSLTKFFGKLSSVAGTEKPSVDKSATNYIGSRQSPMADITNVRRDENESQLVSNLPLGGDAPQPTTKTQRSSDAAIPCLSSQRRTLGVRRSFNGWSNRKNQ